MLVGLGAFAIGLALIFSRRWLSANDALWYSPTSGYWPPLMARPWVVVALGLLFCLVGLNRLFG